MENYMNDLKIHYPSNVSKWLLWEDPLYCHLSPEIFDFNLDQHYREVEDQLSIAAYRDDSLYPNNRRLEFVAKLSRVLRLKLQLRSKLRDFLSRDERKELITTFINTDLEDLRKEIESLWRMHRRLKILLGGGW
jgi:hypothetical protein